MKIHVFENYMVIYTGRKMDENQGDFREEQRAYCKIRGLLGKSASEIKSELDTVYGERILFHIEQLPDVYLILKKVGLVLKTRPVRVDQFGPPLKMMLPLSNLLLARFMIYNGRDKWFIGLEFIMSLLSWKKN